MSGDRSPILAAAAVFLVAVLLASCAASREGWGRGRFVVIHESPDLQVRRSTIRLDDPSGDHVMNWIGARAPDGQPSLMELTVTVFDDRNGDARLQPDEVRFQRSVREKTSKILISDLRIQRPGAAAHPTVVVEARTLDGATRTDTFAFQPDR